MQAVIDWTYLPWENARVCGVICWTCVALGLLFAIGTFVIAGTNAGHNIHVAPFTAVRAYGAALFVNTAMFTLFFWYAALPIGLFISTVCIVSARGVQKNALVDEKNGKWGLDPDLRQVRGEMFSDLSPEEQIRRKKEVERVFRKTRILPFYLLTICLPFLLVVILYFCGASYVWIPHAL